MMCTGGEFAADSIAACFSTAANPRAHLPLHTRGALESNMRCTDHKLVAAMFRSQ